jgi:hypothetical protein
MGTQVSIAMASLASVERYSEILSAPEASPPGAASIAGKQSGFVDEQGRSDDIFGEQQPATEDSRAAFEDLSHIQDVLINRESDSENEIIKTDQLRLRPRWRGKQTRKRFGDYAVILRRKFVQNGPGLEPGEVRFEIQSHQLQEVFRTKFSASAGSVDLTADPIRIPRPYYLLFHQRKSILEYVEDEAEPGETRQRMKLVKDFILDNPDLKCTIQDYEHLFPAGLVTFNILWTIYVPGADVIVRDDNTIHCYRCMKVVRDVYQNTPRYVIHVEGIDYSGKFIGRTRKSLEVVYFQGSRDISSLSVQPLDTYPEKEALKELLRARYRRFTSLVEANHTHMHYEGLVWIPDPEADRFERPTPIIQGFTVILPIRIFRLS